MSDPEPIELSGKRKEAYKKIMKATADSSKPKIMVFSLLDEVYDTKKSKKSAIETLVESDNIPVETRGEQVINVA